MKKKLLIYFLIFIFVIFLADLMCYIGVYIWQVRLTKSNGFENVHFPSYFKNRLVFHDHSTLYFFEKDSRAMGFREPCGLRYKGKAIWLFGGSFAYGADMTLSDGVPDDKTFGYFLSEAFKRPVYNRAYEGWGIQHMLYWLKKPETFEQLPEPEYVIFFHTSDNMLKLVNITYDVWNNGAYLRYKLNKDGSLEEIKPVLEPLWNFYFVKAAFAAIEYKVFLSDKNFDKNFDLMKAIFFESKKIVNKKYPNSRFVILKYNEVNGFGEDYYNSPRWDELEKAGIVVVDAGKLINKDLKSEESVCPDKYHPSEKVLKELAAALYAELQN